ncbi:hypothetical protein APLC1_0749 [Limnospira platensis C1]|nr:hypothetical protein APLC1_0749 [Arthrospira platensis C1]
MFNLFLITISLLLLAIVVGLTLYLLSPRKYQSADSVANSYDDWTNDGILEFYWGNISTSVTMVHRHNPKTS